MSVALRPIQFRFLKNKMATVTAIARSQRVYEHLLVRVIIIKVARVHVYN